MSLLLARMARTLTQHWVRSLFAAIAVIVLLGAAAGAGGEAADDFSIPGTESQQAIDLFKAHTPALAGADSTLVFSVEDGKVTDAGHRAAIDGALERCASLDGVATVADPFAEGGASPRTARSPPSTSATTPSRGTWRRRTARRCWRPPRPPSTAASRSRRAAS